VSALVHFEAVTKRFGEVAAVDGVSLEIAEGEFFALLGPSGCGKTTLMRLLAGFAVPDAGRILLNGQDIAGLPPHRRPSSMMFQTYALFPHLSVEKNIAFGLKQQGWDKARAAARVEEMLGLVRLEGLNKRRPDQLSGGQAQRVALARALAPGPKILLLDEPLAALDRKLREETQLELKSIQRTLGVTFMIVTHDRDEAMTVADRIAVMNQGAIAQVGTPRELYEQPVDAFVAEFLGEVNWFKEADGWIGIRPEAIALSRDEPAGIRLPGRVVETAYLGDRAIHVVETAPGRRVRVARPNTGGVPFRIGEAVWVGYALDAALKLRR
jgi:putrescine transport system ATP-binding protein